MPDLQGYSDRRLQLTVKNVRIKMEPGKEVEIGFDDPDSPGAIQLALGMNGYRTGARGVRSVEGGIVAPPYHLWVRGSSLAGLENHGANAAGEGG